MLDRDQVIDLLSNHDYHLQKLLEVCNGNLNAADVDGITITHWCVKTGRVDYLRGILNHAFDNEALSYNFSQTDTQGNSPLHTAFENADYTIIKIILDFALMAHYPLTSEALKQRIKNSNLHGCISSADNQGDTVLHIALRSHSPNKDIILFKLFFLRANYLTPNATGVTPLSLAVDHPDKAILDLFIREMLYRLDTETLDKLRTSNITNILSIICSNIEGESTVGTAFQPNKKSMLWLLAHLIFSLRHNAGINIDHQSLIGNIEEKFFFCALIALFVYRKEQESFIAAAQPLLYLIVLASETDNIRKLILTAYANYLKWLMAKNEFEQDDGFMDAWEILNNIVALSKNMPNFPALNAIDEPLLLILGKEVLARSPYSKQFNHLNILNTLINKLPVTSANTYQLSYEINVQLGLSSIALEKLSILKKYYSDTHGAYCDEELAKLHQSGFIPPEIDLSLEPHSANDMKRKGSEAQLLNTHGLLKDRSSHTLEEKHVNSFASQPRPRRSS